MESVTSVARTDTDSNGITRRTALKTLGAAAAGICGLPAATGKARAVVPGSLTFYQLAMDGQTSAGVSFVRSGVLAVSPTIDRTGVSGTGVNARDVAIRSGFPGGVPEAGSVWFATNTALYPAVNIPANSNVRAAELDIASVTQPDTNTLAVRLDGDPGGVARAAQLNSFNALSGLAANVYQIYQGGIDLRFSEDATAVEGEMLFGGIGYVFPGSASMYASFRGTVIQPGV